MGPTVRTDRTVTNDKPESIIRDNKQGTWMLIDFAITGDKNVIRREGERILKYEDLTIGIQRMWNVKAKSDTGNNRGDWDYFKITSDST